MIVVAVLAEPHAQHAEDLQGAEMTPRDAGADAVAAMLDLAEKHNLRRRAEASCHECIRSAVADGSLAGLAPEDIQAVFQRSALVFDHSTLPHPFVETRLGLYVIDPTAGWCFDGLRPVGHYSLITRLDGTVEDDYLILDEPTEAGPAAAPDSTA